MAHSKIANLVLLLSLLAGALPPIFILILRHRKAGAGALLSRGAGARVETLLNPEGSVIAGRELFRARSNQSGITIEPGVIVRVVGASGHLVLVEPVNSR